MLFLFDLMRSPIAVRNALKRSKTAEGALAVLLGGLHATTCPVAAKIAPDILGWGNETPHFIFLFGVLRIPLAFWAVQNCKDGREHTRVAWLNASHK